MKALFIICSSSDEAGTLGQALSQGEWNVVGTGPVDGVDIKQGDTINHVAGSWVVLASKKEIVEP